jgi:cyclin-dependent kinase-like
VLHRDIKPENVLVTGLAEVRLCDFGFARNVPSAHQRALLTSYVATRWYRAPEMLLGSAYDGKVDVWAAGCVLWELFTGQPLFTGDTACEMLLGINKGVDLSQLTAHLGHRGFSGVQLQRGGAEPIALAGMPTDFAEVLEACLKAQPHERASAQTLLSMRCDAKNNPAVLARPTISTVRLG